MWMILKQKISEELSAHVTKIKHEIADDLSARGTKIANELDGKNNTTITAEIKRILTDDVYRKLTSEINTKIINELSTRLSEINTELNSKLIAEITKINTRDAGYASEAQKIFSMVNNITTKVNNIEEACRNEFSRINVVIEDLQNKINQHYAVVQRSDFDQQSVSNESEANSTNESEANSTNESETNSSPSSSSGSSNLSGIFVITGDIRIRFKEHFDRLMKARNYAFDEMCFSVVVDIRCLGGNIKISTVKNFYNGVSGSKISTVNQINAWVASFNNNGTFPLSVWSHKHFIENTDILDFEQATRLWYENLTTIRNLPGSLLSKELFDVIIKRKMGDTLTINKKKRKYAEDEVHTSSVDNEKAHTDPEKVITNQDSEDSFTTSEKVITNQDNEMAFTAPEKTKTFNNEHIDSASERSSEKLEDENNEELKFDLLDILLSFQCEATWKVGNINITNRFQEYQKDISASLHKASCENFISEEVFINRGKMTLSKKVATSFNDLCSGLPMASSKTMEKITEEKHCYKFLYPIIKPFFLNPLKEYKVVLNHATAGSRKRPDLSCMVDNVTILNLEIKPLRCIPLQIQKDFLKAQLRAHKSINIQLENKNGSGESVIDKASIPLYEYAISHVIVLEEQIGKIAENYKHRDNQKNQEN
ncbi:8545_t:CDS:2 [Cetraspora pellucida]|uniref:8545_t:CDS:1 n=1 Tax=Cetraspora pellucida TaxID=1433469 RepID=A0A9N9F9D7_9GLOM|nr:8545_t:CDS:2 [Cetraspora pellucida]